MRPNLRRKVRDGLEWCGVVVLALRVVGRRVRRFAVVSGRLRRLTVGRVRVPA